MKTVDDIMTASPATCSPDTPLQDVARMMVDYDCGCIPVVRADGERIPVGVVTDRDIASRVVAEGRDARVLSAGDVMSQPAISVARDASLDDCLRTMTDRQVRRVVVVDGGGNCCGIVAQADVALNATKQKTGEVVRQVSQPMPALPQDLSDDQSEQQSS